MTQSPLRQFNHGLVLNALKDGGVLSRSQLISVTGLSRSTVAAIVRDLTSEGVVEAFVDPNPRADGNRGRPSEGLRITQQIGLVGGIDYGHAHVRAALATPGMEFIAESEVVDIDTNESPEAALSTGRDLLTELWEHASGKSGRLLGVGVGLPSPIDPATGLVSDNNILPNWAHTDPAAVLSAELNVPVHLDNDANLGATAELHALDDPHANLIFVKASTGIGAGLVFNGAVYRAATGTAGEIGHVHVSAEQNICRCGSRGCLETVVSLPRVIRDLQAVHPALTTAADLADLIARGDAAALRVVGDAGSLIGQTLAGICNVLAPDSVIIGGELGGIGEAFIGPLRQTLQRHTQAMVVSRMTVQASTFAARSEIVGAVHLAAQHTRL